MEKRKKKVYIGVGLFIAAFAIIIYLSNRGGISFQEFTDTIFDIDNEKEAYARMENYVASLSTFDTEQLTTEEAYTYNLLHKKFNHGILGDEFFYYNELLSPSGGNQGQYPILLTEYTFRKKEDIEDYLMLLSNTPTYFESLMLFESKKAKLGLFMPDYSLNKLSEQCNSIVDEDSLNRNAHFLQTSFQERINNAITAQIITLDEGNSFVKENNRLLKEQVLTSYIKLGQSLSSLSGNGKNQNGLFYLPQGKEYYEWLFVETTGSYTDLDTVYNKLAKDYYDNIHSLNQELSKFQNSCDLTMDDIDYFPLSIPEDMVNHLHQNMGKDFPSISSILPQILPNLAIKSVSPSLEDYTAPAYYLIPPIDEVTQNTIYVNRSAGASGIHLYTTLAHEGYPGHLYQTLYYQIYQTSKQDLPVRSILNYGGYVEGWALYTELYSFEYAATLLKENTGKESYASLYSIYADERRSQLALFSLLDIGIHYYGMTFERAFEIMSSYGISNETQAKGIYEYIVEEPANYPKYYWGYLEFMKLKESAKKNWGHSYSDYRFHQFVLQAGPSDFESLNHKLLKKRL